MTATGCAPVQTTRCEIAALSCSTHASGTQGAFAFLSLLASRYRTQVCLPYELSVHVTAHNLPAASQALGALQQTPWLRVAVPGQHLHQS